MPSGSWVGLAGVMPIQQLQPPNDVSPSFQMICGGPGWTCQPSPMFAGPGFAFPHTSTFNVEGWVVAASPSIRLDVWVEAPKCASSQVCMSAADDLMSEAAPADTARAPLGCAWATGSPLGTIVTVSGIFSG